MEQKAGENGNRKRRLQTYQKRNIVLSYIIKLENGCKHQIKAF
nr:MAG TPA: hypothetical protein [Caudoviricetes sp.]